MIIEIPNCQFCGDGGLHDKTGEWDFCRCPAGVRMRQGEPEAADKQNAVMRRLAFNVAHAKGHRRGDVEAARKTFTDALERL